MTRPTVSFFGLTLALDRIDIRYRESGPHTYDVQAHPITEGNLPTLLGRKGGEVTTLEAPGIEPVRVWCDSMSWGSAGVHIRFLPEGVEWKR